MKARLTSGRVAEFTCPADKPQAFLWDAQQPGLALRATATGTQAFIYQSRLQGKSVRITIGSPDNWPIAKARGRARELQQLIDSGRDPRIVIADAAAADIAKRAADRAEALTVADAWRAYLNERRPLWSARHSADHIEIARPGGRKASVGTRGRGVTTPGPLWPLMNMRLRDLNSSTVEQWAQREAKQRPARARLALRLLKAFLNWCAEHETYRVVARPEAAKTRRARLSVGTASAKSDVLLREQLPAWFKAVQGLDVPQQRAYLQILLLVGCRAGELLDLEWSDIDERWRTLRIRDKVDGERNVPLTPYVESLLLALPRTSRWVFSSASSRTGRIQRPNVAHARVARAAGVLGLTLHGLRRSFKSLRLR